MILTVAQQTQLRLLANAARMDGPLGGPVFFANPEALALLRQVLDGLGIPALPGRSRRATPLWLSAMPCEEDTQCRCIAAAPATASGRSWWWRRTGKPVRCLPAGP